jgi:hypothetical protein
MRKIFSFLHPKSHKVTEDFGTDPQTQSDLLVRGTDPHQDSYQNATDL